MLRNAITVLPYRYMEKLENQFYAMLLNHSSDECLLWPYSTNKWGYGKLMINRKIISTHRLALAHSLGRPIADGLIAMHSCDVRHCFNPRHLSEGTYSQNMRACISRGRRPNCQGERSKRNKLTEAQVHEIKRRALCGEAQAALAREFAINQSIVSRIKSGERWGHIRVACHANT